MQVLPEGRSAEFVERAVNDRFGYFERGGDGVAAQASGFELFGAVEPFRTLWRAWIGIKAAVNRHVGNGPMNGGLGEAEFFGDGLDGEALGTEFAHLGLHLERDMTAHLGYLSIIEIVSMVLGYGWLPKAASR